MPALGTHLRLARCPHCGVDTPNLEQHWGGAVSSQHGNRYWVVYRCSRCGDLVMAVAPDAGREVFGVYPPVEIVHADVPPPASEYLTQAIASRHAPAGAVMLAASAVDAMLKAKSYTEGSLYARIEKAARDHVITDEMAAWAHEVRLDANDQRHADEAATLPDSSDAARSISFAKALAEFLFVLPAQVRRGRKPATPSA